MNPKISIIIPVYNVEQYLRECLESVVNQTLRDIQILCVDHSSTDGSLAILEEFAVKDERIKIIPCENTRGGPGQARNAAFAHIEGKYTYFTDSDDWLDLQLCEKVYYRLEQSGNDVLLLFHHCVDEGGQSKRVMEFAPEQWPMTSTDTSAYLDFFCPPWTKVVRTAFLREHEIRFPEGILPEDNFFHWALLVNSSKVGVIPEKLYYYRLREGSQIGMRGEYVAKHILVFSLIKDYLLSIGKYEQYRERFLQMRLGNAMHTFENLAPSYRKICRQVTAECLDSDDIAFLHEENKLSLKIRTFCLELIGDPKVKQLKRSHFFNETVSINKVARPILRPIEAMLRFLQGRPQKKQKQFLLFVESQQNLISELNDMICLLSKEVVELREENQSKVTSAALSAKRTA